MRTVAVAALLALVALLVASSAGARDPKEPQKRTSAADVALAKSIVLVRSDFAGGWKAAPKPKPQPPCSIEPDESKLVKTAGLDPTFVWKDGFTQVGSEVDVFANAKQARLDWKLSTLRLMSVCLLESARDALGKKAKVAISSAEALPAPKLGERSLHFRIVLTGSKNRPPIVTELIGVGIGRISVVLHAFSLATALPPSGLDALTATLAKRLAKASGAI
ncbi:MAG TPA: hypothetical protein VFJ91_03895 [Gaiellaceae bacterium]|nr:hypothetical protein [Gaiellaceae bacterium]